MDELEVIPEQEPAKKGVFSSIGDRITSVIQEAREKKDFNDQKKQAKREAEELARDKARMEREEINKIKKEKEIAYETQKAYEKAYNRELNKKSILEHAENLSGKASNLVSREGEGFARRTKIGATKTLRVAFQGYGRPKEPPPQRGPSFYISSRTGTNYVNESSAPLTRSNGGMPPLVPRQNALTYPKNNNSPSLIGRGSPIGFEKRSYSPGLSLLPRRKK